MCLVQPELLEILALIYTNLAENTLHSTRLFNLNCRISRTDALGFGPADQGLPALRTQHDLTTLVHIFGRQTTGDPI